MSEQEPGAPATGHGCNSSLDREANTVVAVASGLRSWLLLPAIGVQPFRKMKYTFTAPLSTSSTHITKNSASNSA